MKINIYFPIDKYGGGGNQFLKALKKQFMRQSAYADNWKDADAILFNSHHNLLDLLEIKRLHPEKILIHRIDGPVWKLRDRDLEIDRLIYKFNGALADGTVYQSNWSKNENLKLGLAQKKYAATIINAPDENIFFLKNADREKNDRFALISDSNSSNWKKGFRLYQYLDEHLDFSKFRFVFVGNSPVAFKNIEQMKRVGSVELAEMLRNSDAFITASQDDPCSNSLIEALHCGIPAIVLDSGGHPEIIGQAGEVFTGEGDILDSIRKVAGNYDFYKKNIQIKNISSIADEYMRFTEKILADTGTGDYVPIKISFWASVGIRLSYVCLKLKSRAKYFFGKII